MMGRDSRLKQAVGGSLFTRIKESRVLLIGAGGVGCELLKNLVLSGFGEIHIVDLDTIDLSNLNRQFLFGMQHIKKPKAIVAKETAGKFNPNVKIEAIHANIKDPRFNVKWFKSFNLVFNALDNVDARRHVNRMCLTVNVPLIESGTTGYQGQVQPIMQGVTECYECNEKPVPKSFPVCTIRSTPSQPIHCIVWAKSYLFAEVFGTSEEATAELDMNEDSENAKEIANLKREAEELKNIREKIDSPEFVVHIFDKVFKRDIERLLSMEEMWTTRTPPKPLDHAKVAEAASGLGPEVAAKDQQKWTLAENYAVFADSVERLAKRVVELKASAREGEAPPILSFDKDDEDTLDFVAASANLRSYIFGIDSRTKFDIKQMAGNIIPAIATTNAITAGMCVLQAFKFLKNDIKSSRMVFIAKNDIKALNGTALEPPTPNCQVCGVARLALEANIDCATLGELVENVIRGCFKYGNLSVLTSQMLYDTDFEDNLEMPLRKLGFVDETFVTVIDDDDSDDVEPRVNLVIAVTHNENLDESIPVPDKIEIPRKMRKEEEAEETDDDDILAPVENGAKHSLEDPEDGGTAKKRKLDGDLAVGERRPSKRQVVGSSADGPIAVDDDGSIMID